MTQSKTQQPPATLYLIRHGEVIPEMRDTFYGDLDVPLGERGWGQSLAVAERLADVPLEVVYASPLERAWKLAELLAEPRDLPVRRVENFRERHFGPFQAFSHEKLMAEHHGEYMAWKNNRVFHRVEGAENFEDLSARVIPAMEELVAAFGGKRIALVCHAGPIRVMLAHAMGLPLEHIFRMTVNFCSVNVIEFPAQGAPTVKLLNG